MAKTIVCVHLLDDFSGSAKVFTQAVRALEEAGHTTQLVVGSYGDGGFVRRERTVQTVPYAFHTNRWRLLVSFALVQLRLYRRISHMVQAGHADAVYVSTVLPAGAILAGSRCGKPVVTHVHEVGLGTRSLFRVLLAVAVRHSSRIVAVSDYVRRTLALPGSATTVVPNSLSSEEWQRATGIAASADTKARALREGGPFRALMVSSLKWYKGIDSFVELARRSQQSDDPVLRRTVYRLVLNCEEDQFSRFKESLEPNLHIELFRRPSSVYDHYESAHLLLNLSLPDGWVETFGLTLLEAMACGVPVVAPTVGGCTELFTPGDGGWRIDARDTPGLTARVRQLASDADAWAHASAAATRAASAFAWASFAERLTRQFET